MKRRDFLAALTFGALSPSFALAAQAARLPSRQMVDLIGLYGAPDRVLVVYEKDGRLFADGLGATAQPLKLTSGGDYKSADGKPAITVSAQGARVGDATLAKRDFGAEVEAGIRRTVRADPVALRSRAEAALPPAEQGKLPSELVTLRTIPGIKLDIRYATTNNFMGLPLYERAEAYLQRPAAAALARVSQALRSEGYGLLVHDGYRPWTVTWMFWEATPPASRAFVANPAEGSRHNRGCAVDLTLYDLATGKAMEMPGRYDEMSIRSYVDFMGGTSRQRALRDLLRRAMEAEGFEVYAEEWWHFDYRDWARYPIGNQSFSQLSR